MRKDELIMKTKEKNYNLYYPLFQKEMFIIKKIGEGFILALPNHQEIALNETMMEILNLCNGDNSLAELIEVLYDTYDASVETITGDLIDTVFKAWGVGLLEWKDSKNLFMEIYTYSPSEEVRYSVAEYKDIKKIFTNCEGKAFYNSKFKQTVKYSSTLIESAIKNQGTLYFEMFLNDNRAITMGYTPIRDYSDGGKTLFYQVDYLYFNRDVSIEKQMYDEFICWTLSFENEVNNVVCFELVINEKNNGELIKFGFEQIGEINNDAYYRKEVRKDKE